MIKSVIALIATSALAATVIQHLGRQQRLKRQHHERQHHDEVDRWEGEGGNLPDTDPAPARPVSRRPRRR